MLTIACTCAVGICGRMYGLPTLFSVDLAGMTLPAFNSLGFGEMFFKQADPLITRNLKERGLLFLLVAVDGDVDAG